MFKIRNSVHLLHDVKGQPGSVRKISGSSNVCEITPTVRVSPSVQRETAPFGSDFEDDFAPNRLLRLNGRVSIHGVFRRRLLERGRANECARLTCRRSCDLPSRLFARQARTARARYVARSAASPFRSSSYLVAAATVLPIPKMRRSANKQPLRNNPIVLKQMLKRPKCELSVVRWSPTARPLAYRLG